MKTKRRIAAIFLCFVCLFFSGCGTQDFDASVFDESFRSEYAALFQAEECEHHLQYEDAARHSQDIDADIYHYTSCKWNCESLEDRYEPHTIDIGRIAIANSHTLKENGCAYHHVRLSCEKCGKIFTIYALCKTQDENCKNGEECLSGLDWREVLCDTPYEILSD